ncbi:putative Rossmann fold flavoprotein [Rhodovulum iodosum]|uniref:Rossmann fold flavoprotein n=1 Tax=Rhodovulum iodosum TaxID=68291 RepID=A0ABV3XWI1_9RHOB|nr:NAD(P)/FAD-dependent oxidoreductase [Rhodovulum robiginosum]RSK33438.1 NAD(P)/FAD-dependent oxidoreductase [Rhodovulum robiginosum]
MTSDHPCIIIGAGAAGLMCAAHAGPGTLLIDHAAVPGEKIRISGGGRCNFTNLYCGPENFLSDNPHFAKSALARFTQWDFIDLVDRHAIAWHEKSLGQLFCDDSARQIVSMLRDEARRGGAVLRLGVSVAEIDHRDGQFVLTLSTGETATAPALVLATGGKSIPKMGATDFAYRVARQFGHRVTDTRPALVPLTLSGAPLEALKPLAGVSLPVRAACNGAGFDEALLFTHRGLSGPAVLQVSSYWREGDAVALDLLPGRDALAALRALRAEAGRKSPANALAALLPGRLAAHLGASLAPRGNMADLSDAALRDMAAALSDWRITPSGSEGYRTAEVTLGGVATDALDARSMESRNQPGLYVIGEAVDVTGWLGGYNFQWAWSSGWAAGTAIAARRAAGAGQGAAAR